MNDIFSLDKETHGMSMNCYDIVHNGMAETLLWYYQEYPKIRRELAEHFKYAFAFLADQLVEELEREDDE